MRITLLVFIFLHLFGSTLCQALPSEKDILLQFKGNVTDDPSGILNSWSSTAISSPCQDYTGVYCNDEGNVERIVLWNTSLSGVLSPSLSGLKALRILTLYGNRFTGNIPVEFAGIETIWKLNFSSNALSGLIPEFLGDFRSLRLLDLSRNGFVGEIPGSLFRNCFKTRFISLSHNSLTGSIPLSIANCSNLSGFDFSYNNLSGSFPSQICDIPNIAYVSLRSNSLVGGVRRDDILNCHSLEVFDLGSNFFTGVIPFDVIRMTNMSYFNASLNQFQGEIPEIRMCSGAMEVFDVSGNRLTGALPSSIVDCGSLKVLDVGFNQLGGSIPADIARLMGISVIRLGNNTIQGIIPAELGNIELLQVLDLHDLELVGVIPEELSKCRFLLELDLSGNNLEGGIPQTLDNMTYLNVLDLHGNRLNGDIPSSLGELSRIQLLDLSENELSGAIPSSLGNLTRLTHFNLSFNNLSGAIPLTPTIQVFGSTAFFHNPNLCGAPLEMPCPANGAGRSSSGRTRGLSVSAIVAIVAAGVILIGVFIICILNVRARKRRRDDLSLVTESTPPASTHSNPIIGKLVLFSKTLPSKYEDWEAGTKALLDKECLVGGGSIGTVYRTSFEGGILIAVKKLETLGRIKSQDEFEQEIGRLANFKHSNLVAFQGYYWSSTMQLILSEFVPNGNLYQHLHGLLHSGASSSSGRSDLHWSRRFQIALGTAKALAYLHHDCKPQVLHLNIKSTNILLDENYEAKLSDYGLVKLLPILDNYGLTKFHTAVGYVAPELAQSFRFSDKCDVFSFGVILLELVTGRKPVESPAASEVVILCDFVRGLLENGLASDCFDRSLRGFAENELIQVMKLGLICTSEAPFRRPNMAEVVQVLESIRSN